MNVNDILRKDSIYCFQNSRYCIHEFYTHIKVLSIVKFFYIQIHFRFVALGTHSCFVLGYTPYPLPYRVYYDYADICNTHKAQYKPAFFILINSE